ncbi:hypothetical protein Dimus_009647 [Dionaea muscipula]
MFFVYLFFSIALFAPFGHGDQQLMKQVCHFTGPREGLCMECLMSNPQSPGLGIRELAGTTIYCAYDQSVKVKDAYTSYASRESNQILKSGYSECASMIDNQVAEKITVALNRWGDRNYLDSIVNLSYAQNGLRNCRDLIGTALRRAGVSQFSRDLGYGMDKLDKQIDVAYEIEQAVSAMRPPS